MKKTQINLNVNDVLKSKLKEIADKKGLTITALVISLLWEYVEGESVCKESILH